jgi:hypothetical protein
MALAAAGWWFASAGVHLPAPGQYWVKAPEDAPFLMAISDNAPRMGMPKVIASPTTVLTYVEITQNDDQESSAVDENRV